MSDQEPPRGCASPPCLMHEVDPAYMGLMPDVPLPAERAFRPANEQKKQENDRASAKGAKAGRSTTSG